MCLSIFVYPLGGLRGFQLFAILLRKDAPTNGPTKEQISMITRVLVRLTRIQMVRKKEIKQSTTYQPR